MSGWLFLTVAVAFSTILWPVARWGLQGDAKPAVAGLWTSIAMGIVALCGAKFDLRATPAVWVAGALMAVAYSVGFWILIMQALKIGPAGPTVTVNNMAMVCGVLYGVLWLHPHGWPHPLVVAGVVGTCVALVLIGLGQKSNESAGTPRRWLPMVLVGGAFSGLSFICQTYIGEVQRPYRFAFLAIGALGSALILIAPAWRTLFRRREAIAGIAIGAMSGVGILLTLAAFEYLGSAIVLPFSVTTPVLLMLVIGHFAYHEHLGRAQLAGCIVGAASVLMLALGSGA